MVDAVGLTAVVVVVVAEVVGGGEGVGSERSSLNPVDIVSRVIFYKKKMCPLGRCVWPF